MRPESCSRLVSAAGSIPITTTTTTTITTTTITVYL